MPLRRPLISIVTVCYNAESLIEKTLKSVFDQTNRDFEYIVVDGRSGDSTMEIVGRYGDRIDKIVSEKDSGIYNAMNKGVALAAGGWILFLNAGDVFVDEYVLEKVSPYLKLKKNDVVYGDIMKRDRFGELFIKRSTPPGNKHKMYFCHQAVFCRTEICRKYPFDEAYALSADFKFFKTIFKKGYHFEQTDIPVAIFDTQGASNRNREQGLMENVGIIKEADSFADKIRLLPRVYFVIWRIRLTKRKGSK